MKLSLLSAVRFPRSSDEHLLGNYLLHITKRRTLLFGVFITLYCATFALVQSAPQGGSSKFVKDSVFVQKLVADALSIFLSVIIAASPYLFRSRLRQETAICILLSLLIAANFYSCIPALYTRKYHQDTVLLPCIHTLGYFILIDFIFQVRLFVGIWFHLLAAIFLGVYFTLSIVWLDEAKFSVALGVTCATALSVNALCCIACVLCEANMRHVFYWHFIYRANLHQHDAALFFSSNNPFEKKNSKSEIVEHDASKLRLSGRRLLSMYSKGTDAISVEAVFSQENVSMVPTTGGEDTGSGVQRFYNNLHGCDLAVDSLLDQTEYKCLEDRWQIPPIDVDNNASLTQEQVMLQVGNSWELNIEGLETTVQGNSLRWVAEKSLTLALEEGILFCDSKFIQNLSQEIQYLHTDNKYHNQQHAAEVTHLTMKLLSENNFWEKQRDDKDCRKHGISVILAALSHCMGHPGKTDNCLEAMFDPLAMRYTDGSIAKHYAASLLFQTLSTSRFNIFKDWSVSDYMAVKKITTKFILFTDYRYRIRHYNFKNDNEYDFYALLLLAADVGHSTFRWEAHMYWVASMWHELNKELEQTNSMLHLKYLEYNEYNKQAIQEQICFLNEFVSPLYKHLDIYFGTLEWYNEAISNLEMNINQWTILLKKNN